MWTSKLVDTTAPSLARRSIAIEIAPSAGRRNGTSLRVAEQRSQQLAGHVFREHSRRVGLMSFERLDMNFDRRLQISLVQFAERRQLPDRPPKARYPRGSRKTLPRRAGISSAQYLAKDLY